jgi:hypothetical protein
VQSNRPRNWDVAPLMFVGVTVGLLCPLVLAGSSTGLAAVLTFTGLVLSLTAMARWSRRSRRPLV